MLQEVNRCLAAAPPGSLNETTSHGVSQYHQRFSRKRSIYLSKKRDTDTICALAQKDYNLQVKQAILDELHAIEVYEQEKSISAEDVYSLLKPERQQYVIPYDGFDQKFVERWYSQHQPWAFNLQPFTGNYTYKGIQFRSRAELILATLLDQLGIPWVFEYPIQVTKDGYTETIFPDYTVLNVRTRQTFYLEYFGKMSDPKYMETNYRRLKLYEENGIFLGKQLIIIGESQEEPLDIPHTEKVLREYLT